MAVVLNLSEPDAGQIDVGLDAYGANRDQFAALDGVLQPQPVGGVPEQLQHRLCPVCAKGQLRPVAELAPRRLPCPAPRRRSEPITGG